MQIQERKHENCKPWLITLYFETGLMGLKFQHSEWETLVFITAVTLIQIFREASKAQIKVLPFLWQWHLIPDLFDINYSCHQR